MPPWACKAATLVFPRHASRCGRSRRCPWRNTFTDRLPPLRCCLQERRAYKKAKAEMYPTPTEGLKTELKRIQTGEKWDGTQSFYSGWR